MKTLINILLCVVLITAMGCKKKVIEEPDTSQSKTVQSSTGVLHLKVLQYCPNYIPISANKAWIKLYKTKSELDKDINPIPFNQLHQFTDDIGNMVINDLDTITYWYKAMGDVKYGNCNRSNIVVTNTLHVSSVTNYTILIQ